MALAFFPAREVAFEVFGRPVRWYGVMYVTAFLLAWYLLPRIGKFRNIKLSGDDWLYVVTWGVAGVLVGGRLGFVLLYEPAYFWRSPLEIFWLAGGGMSSHGGFIGVALALWRAKRKLKINYRALLDVVMIPAGIGLALGRAGNVINAELFFPPEAAWLEVGGILLLTGLTGLGLQKKIGWYSRPGSAAGIWLILYSLIRFGMEFFREGEIIWGIPAGILYSVPLLAAGVGLLFFEEQKL